MLKISIKQAKSISRRKIKARALYHTFFANYGKDREKAYELYFSGKRNEFTRKGNRDGMLARKLLMKQEKSTKYDHI